MEAETILAIGIAVFGASLLQAATGIGYGVIAGPVFLVFLNGSEAFQISTIHNLLIAVLMVPLVLRSISIPTLKFLIFGGFIGLAFGFWIQLAVDVVYLKIASLLMITLVSATLINGMRNRMQTEISQTPKSGEISTIGALAGIMGGMLAMPGPLAATWMSLKGYSKDEIRATILGFFVFAYGTTLTLYFVVSGIDAAALSLSVKFAPVVILGIWIGNLAASFLSEKLFQQILLVILLATIVLLLVSI